MSLTTHRPGCTGTIARTVRVASAALATRHDAKGRGRKDPADGDGEDPSEDPGEGAEEAPMDAFMPTPKELRRINKYTLRDHKAEELFSVPVLACDNQIDRHFERLKPDALRKLGRTYPGRPGLLDHDWSAGTQTSRVYDAEVVTDHDQRSKIPGEPYTALMLKQYMLRSEGNEEMRQALAAGILKESSVGFFLDYFEVNCSICGEAIYDWMGDCSHFPGFEYDGSLCYGEIPEHDELEGAENSFVAVPAQPAAGTRRPVGKAASATSPAASPTPTKGARSTKVDGADEDRAALLALKDAAIQARVAGLPLAVLDEAKAQVLAGATPAEVYEQIAETKVKGARARLAASLVKAITPAGKATPLFDGRKQRANIAKLVAERTGADAASKGVVPFQDHPLADEDTAWDAGEAEKRLREWAGGPDKDAIDWKKYRKGFVWYDADAETKFGSYKLPICDVFDGKVKAVPKAIYAAAGALDGARGGLDLSEADVEKAKAHLEKYYAKLDQTPPWKTDEGEDTEEDDGNPTGDLDEDDDPSAGEGSESKGMTPDEIRGIVRAMVGEAMAEVQSATVAAAAKLVAEAVTLAAGPAAAKEVERILSAAPVLDQIREMGAGYRAARQEIAELRSTLAAKLASPVIKAPLQGGFDSALRGQPDPTRNGNGVASGLIDACLS